jgi:hypothetical protein
LFCVFVTRSKLFELIFAYAAHGASPIFGEILKRDIVVLGRIIDIAAYLA